MEKVTKLELSIIWDDAHYSNPRDWAWHELIDTLPENVVVLGSITNDCDGAL